MIITGASGLVGVHLTRYLKATGREFEFLRADLTDQQAVDNAMSEVFSRILAKPPQSRVCNLVHLAGISDVATCEADPGKARAVNVQGTAHVLAAFAEEAQGAGLKARVIFAGTAHVYDQRSLGGHEKSQIQLREDDPVDPTNVYALTKFEAEMICRDWALRRQSNGEVGARQALLLRLFNHTHHTQEPRFFLPHLYQTLMLSIAAQRGKQEGDEISVPVGNLDLWRDVSLVSELVRDLVALADSPIHSGAEVFNVCSGRARKLRNLADALAEQLLLSTGSPTGTKIRWVVEESRLRKGEPITLVGSPDKLEAYLGRKRVDRTDQQFITEFLSP